MWSVLWIIFVFCSVSFDGLQGGRGVDHWGHSLNDPIGGIVDYKNWTKTARYSINRDPLLYF